MHRKIENLGIFITKNNFIHTNKTKKKKKETEKKVLRNLYLFYFVLTMR